MAPRSINANIAGRVKKIKTKSFLVPLFEAISNSIHSVETAARGQPSILVELLREPRQPALKLEDADHVPPITGFIVIDNGIGFDDDNMTSFCEADSTFKEKYGGKGVGRFSWLKFFEEARVDSVFCDGSKRMRREFVFSVKGVDEKPVVEVKSEPRTKVRISPLHIPLESKTCKSLNEVAIEIVEHFITYFVTASMPPLKVCDGAAIENIVELYQRSIGKHLSKLSFAIRNHTFEATGFKFFLGNQKHTAFLCGDKRVAEKMVLGQRDPFFTKRFVDEDLRHYAYHVFVQSEYLDRIVNDDRDGFMFPEVGSLDAANGDAVTKEALAHEVLNLARSAMASEIDAIKHSNIATVTTFVSTNAPQYRHLVARHRDAVAAIHDTDKIKIDQALRRLQFEEELKTRGEIAVLLREAEELTDSTKDEWRRKSAIVLSKLNEEGKANLAGYIVQRMMILDLLKKRMEMGDSCYAREEAVHQLIFPMRTTSDEVNYEDQNLWIIDERLSYHYYLASDKPLGTIPAAETPSRKEPDIIVFNRPIALNDRPENERLESIAVVEFKRPGETAVEGAKNPVDQILEYIELIQEGRAETRKGRKIQPTDALYFFGYVICELDALLKKVLSRRRMEVTPDGRGMFGFFPDHHAYIEVISYDKMLDDALKRNRILFEKLHLPSASVGTPE